MSPHPSLDDAKTLLAAAEDLLARAVAAAVEITEGGRRTDDHQVLVERVTYASTEARAARELMDQTEVIRAEGRSDKWIELTAAAGVGDLVASLREQLDYRGVRTCEINVQANQLGIRRSPT